MFRVLVAAWTAASVVQASATPVQKPLLSPDGGAIETTEEVTTQKKGRKLKGRFLQITDIHPDPFYKVYSSTEGKAACHRQEGPAGFYGAETSDCDSPQSLINATFKWIDENLKNEIDFIIWTGDSARHDNDEEHPRSQDQVLGLNEMLVDKFKEVFKERHEDELNKAFEIPIVPTFGNNDILPHNIFEKGPNRWTKLYAQVWRDTIPEEQRHGFDRGGWFYVEVIPNTLAVFSLNTLYFFDSNSAVDGCAIHSEPGYEHMEWLRIQLEFLRQRGMKAIMSGHVPPWRGDQKVGWDETCWQKYTIWMQQYRDVVVGAVYGHMNIEHFILQDFREIDYDVAAGEKPKKSSRKGMGQAQASKGSNDDVVEIELSAPDYLISLQKTWSKLPSAPSSITAGKLAGRDKASKEQKFLDQIGGEFAQRFAVSQVAASVVPNYFPTLRVYEYNISGLNDLVIDAPSPSTPAPWTFEDEEDQVEAADEDGEGLIAGLKRRSWWPIPSAKKPKTPKFTIPNPPAKDAPPGPAYSPQALSFVGYTQYYANLTEINNDFIDSNSDDGADVVMVEEDALALALALARPATIISDPAELEDVHGRDTDAHAEPTHWNRGKHGGKQPKVPHTHPRNFTYEVEYDTAEAKDAYGMRRGLLVREWVELAARIGEWRASWGVLGEGDEVEDEDEVEGVDDYPDDSESNTDSDEDLEEEEDTDTDANTTPSPQASQEHSTNPDKDSKKKQRRRERRREEKRRRKRVERLWYTFASRALVGTLDGEELRERFD